MQQLTKVQSREGRWGCIKQIIQLNVINELFINYLLMLLRLLRRHSFSKDNKLATANAIDSNLEDILSEREKIRRSILRRESANLPAEQQIRNFYDSLVKITLYMRNDAWQSQYLYLLLNYNKLGFRRISDLVHLDRASYLLDLRQVKDQQRWPAIKVVVALQPKIILSGVTKISQFFRENEYFIEPVEMQGGEIEALQSHIDKEVLTHLQSLFWHPKLVFQYSFHTNFSSYQDTSRSYNIFGIMGRNFAIIASRVTQNLINIFKHPQRYHHSKDNFTRSIKELQTQYLTKAPFFGGNRPNHIDFYLMSHLRTRGSCQLFIDYLQRGIGGQFWRWWVRVSSLCQYNPDRITTL